MILFFSTYQDLDGMGKLLYSIFFREELEA
jgi:hypothetical protein